jgi:hypothetical protein
MHDPELPPTCSASCSSSSAEDDVLWGTDAILSGSPPPRIEALRFRDRPGVPGALRRPGAHRRAQRQDRRAERRADLRHRSRAPALHRRTRRLRNRQEGQRRGDGPAPPGGAARPRAARPSARVAWPANARARTATAAALAGRSSTTTAGLSVSVPASRSPSAFAPMPRAALADHHDGRAATSHPGDAHGRHARLTAPARPGGTTLP